MAWTCPTCGWNSPTNPPFSGGVGNNVQIVVEELIYRNANISIKTSVNGTKI